MSEIRYDSNLVRLREGEYQRKDGNYEFRFTCCAQQQSIYAQSLEELRSKEHIAMMLADRPMSLKEREALKVLLKKIKGTDVELLLQESGLIER